MRQQSHDELRRHILRRLPGNKFVALYGKKCSAVNWNAVAVSPEAAGQHTGVPTMRDMPYGQLLRGSPRYRMSLDADTGRVCLFYLARLRSSGVG
ncbi:hypothetical protein EVAR_12158_1 [Eumeta japonica]|uniref:Uncharacterized protein n=1 Tax=Eumeta variegata TaxID=151549 RepID=A0A4C1UGW4_EUMVA|nr:hypothetical protein EVAR_12158_1 [Eumeta japonica]